MPKGTDLKLIQQWCTLYSQQLLPQTKAMVKKMSPNLDAFGLFLPSRMSANVPPNLLEKGLNLVAKASGVTEEGSDNDAVAATESTDAVVASESSESSKTSSTETLPEKIDTAPSNEKSTTPNARKSTTAVEKVDAEVDEEDDEEEEGEEEEYEYEDEEEGEDDEEYEDEDD